MKIALLQLNARNRFSGCFRIRHDEGLGLIFFREHLRRRQWIPIGLATAGVLYLTATLGSFPWLAILLALTFGLYGAVKKAEVTVEMKMYKIFFVHGRFLYIL